MIGAHIQIACKDIKTVSLGTYQKVGDYERAWGRCHCFSIVKGSCVARDRYMLFVRYVLHARDFPRC